jgi:hypothetical protein
MMIEYTLCTYQQYSARLDISDDDLPTIIQIIVKSIDQNARH